MIHVEASCQIPINSQIAIIDHNYTHDDNIIDESIPFAKPIDIIEHYQHPEPVPKCVIACCSVICSLSTLYIALYITYY